METVHALVGQIRLKPAQDHVRPATYAPEEGKDESRIVIEQRHVDGQVVETVLLDSIPSQANRMEEVLYALREELGLPDVVVRFPDATFSQWQLPHRVYDAVIRDSELKGTPFFQTELGRKLAVGDPQVLFNLAPNVLLLGGWNSHAQQEVGHVRAARIERAVTAELVGLDPKPVYRTGSRLDPTGIPGDAPLPPGYEEVKQALGGGRAIRKLSELGLGNVAPNVTFLDVSIAEARHLIFITPVPWRRLGLPEAVQRVLFHLALLGLARLYEEGFHLRSGTAFFPLEAPVLRDPLTGKKEPLPSSKELIGRIRKGLKALPAGYAWDREVLELTPSQALLEAYQGQKELRRSKRGGE